MASMMDLCGPEMQKPLLNTWRTILAKPLEDNRILPVTWVPVLGNQASNRCYLLLLAVAVIVYAGITLGHVIDVHMYEKDQETGDSWATRLGLQPVFDIVPPLVFCLVNLSILVALHSAHRCVEKSPNFDLPAGQPMNTNLWHGGSYSQLE